MPEIDWTEAVCSGILKRFLEEDLQDQHAAAGHAPASGKQRTPSVPAILSRIPEARYTPRWHGPARPRASQPPGARAAAGDGRRCRRRGRREGRSATLGTAAGEPKAGEVEANRIGRP